MIKINLSLLRNFFSSRSAGGIILIFCVIISLTIANSKWADDYSKLLATEIGKNFRTVSLRYTVLKWINDGLMAIFFLFVGLEIKRELVEGELASVKKAALPVFAAVGGMLVPALIFALFNNNTPTSNGWGIPMATDIAFAIAILSILGNKVPPSLKVFLTALAIVDDLGAILVIALFYSSGIHLPYLLYAMGTLVILILFNRWNVKNIFFYMIPGAFMWYFIHHSGIHATIAGVLTALTLPTTPGATESPLEKLEHSLETPVNFFIMPVFALANTNLHLDQTMLEGLLSNMGLGIMLGLTMGKPVGIFIMSWVAVKMNLGKLPKHTRWSQLASAGILAGIGFTMSIFIAMLSYQEEHLQTEAKFVILISSVLAGIVGYASLKRISKKDDVDMPFKS